MFENFGGVILLILAIRIAVIDVKTYFIKNIDLIFSFIIILVFLEVNFLLGFINLCIYFSIYLLTKKQIGVGDVKLSFLIGLASSSIYQLIIGLNSSWIAGGVWAILRKQRQIAFAPWMLLGALFSQFMVI